MSTITTKTTTSSLASGATTNLPQKREGDFSDSFASLAGKAAEPLPDSFRELKLKLVAGNEDKVVASWKRLLGVLKTENEEAAKAGPSIIPVVDFSKLDDDLSRLKDEITKRGVAVIRGVVPEAEARAYKFEVEDYVSKNPQTKGFPRDSPAIFELYWSAPQIRARLHPSLLQTQAALMTKLWRTEDPNAPISLRTPLLYADRLRIRQPGDAKFALGPHQDGGSVERWETEGYGLGGVYDAVFRGEWESYDPYEAGGRVAAVTDLHQGLGAASMFRMFQGWMAMSKCGPNQGTLLVNPLLGESTAYTLLRPFFKPVKAATEVGQQEFLDTNNWVFTGGEAMTSDLQGAIPGHGQELNDALHPHLELKKTMIHMPEVKPGDFVIWHCDTIHAVDNVHNGTGDASVLYIPVCPATEESAKYLVRQKEAFLKGHPAPDFPGGKGESEHLDRPTEEYVRNYANAAGVQSMGLAKLVALENDTLGGKAAVERANVVLGF